MPTKSSELRPAGAEEKRLGAGQIESPGGGFEIPRPAQAEIGKIESGGITDAALARLREQVGSARTNLPGIAPQNLVTPETGVPSGQGRDLARREVRNYAGRHDAADLEGLIAEASSPHES